ncbi:DNA primase [Candidatus Pacearchaeota archaeon]|nr:DNA primase [Candidatus Pacearchaeota archaeon]
MAKISPVSIKYMIHANFEAEGALEKPDVIGAIFGQTEGLLGAELEMRELQKEGKIGRIEVSLKREGKRTMGSIKVPTALDQSETTLIAAAIETIERIGPSDSQIEVERIEDVRGSKREYILERAKKLMTEIKGATDSREISNEIKDAAKMAGIQEYGDEKLPCGDLSGKEVIVVEGRADVLNLMRNGVNNAVAMNGTKLPESIRKLSEEKDITLFVDGDRGGNLIIKNVVENANVKYIAVAPDGKEVEELTGKEILMNLRKKLSVKEYAFKNRIFFDKVRAPKGVPPHSVPGTRTSDEVPSVKEDINIESKVELSDNDKSKLKKLSDENQGTGKAILLDESLSEIKKVSVKGLSSALRKTEKVHTIVIDGTVTAAIIKASEDARCQIIVANNFATTDTKIKLLSL